MQIALLEDEKAWRDAVTRCANAAGWSVKTFDAPEVLLRDMERCSYDVVILDVHLEGQSMIGTDLIGAMRQMGKTMPVLVLTQFADRHGPVGALDGGADDYLAKPFHHEELRARLNALARRAAGRDTSITVIGPLTLSDRYRTARWYERELELRGQGFDILAQLVEARGDVVSHAMLWRHVWTRWANIPPQLQPIQAAVHRLRRDISEVTTQKLVGTVPGIGYRLVMP